MTDLSTKLAVATQEAKTNGMSYCTLNVSIVANEGNPLKRQTYELLCKNAHLLDRLARAAIAAQVSDLCELVDSRGHLLHTYKGQG